jgi:tetratricopeptide (TPR) repeat protein
VDKATAISAHLLADHEHHVGDSRDAISHARLAVRVLEELEDRTGLSMALITLGRIQRDIYYQGAEASVDPVSELGDDETTSELLSDGLELLERAAELAGQEGTIGASALTQIAVTLERQGRLEEAIAVAEEAIGRIQPGDGRHYLEAAVVLGSLYRSAARYADASNTLEAAINATGADPSDRLQLAKLLNVLASSERNSGRYEPAVRHARMSVNLGRQLNNKRHLAHALHTLGAALGYSAPTDSAREEALGYLRESRSLLHDLGDFRGVAMVDTTASRLISARIERPEPSG